MKPENILLTEMDMDRLSSVLERMGHDPYSSHEIQKLNEELERAEVLPSGMIPPDLVTMNSTVQYLNYDDNSVSEIRIVYPEHADISEKFVSVTAPLGAALIGLREYEEIEWKFPDGRSKKLKVLQIVYQPEKNGDLHL